LTAVLAPSPSPREAVEARIMLVRWSSSIYLGNLGLESRGNRFVVKALEKPREDAEEELR
jgi:hypothetical protein